MIGFSWLKPVTQGRKFRYNVLFTLLFFVATMVPDYVLKVTADLPLQFEWLFAGGVLLFGLLLSFTYRFVCLFFIILIFLMQLIQLNHMAYFAMPIDAENLMNIVRESKDVFDVSYLRYTWYVSPLLLLLYGSAVWVFVKKPLIKISWIWLIIFIWRRISLIARGLTAKIYGIFSRVLCDHLCATVSALLLIFSFAICRRAIRRLVLIICLIKLNKKQRIRKIFC